MTKTATRTLQQSDTSLMQVERVPVAITVSKVRGRQGARKEVVLDISGERAVLDVEPGADAVVDEAAAAFVACARLRQARPGE